MSRAHRFDPSRRHWLAASASITALGLVSWVAGPARARAKSVDEDERTPQEDDGDLLDAGLERIAARFPDVNLHRSNHAPMVIEALHEMGRADAIGPWLDDHLDSFQRDERERRPIDLERWRDALGKSDRHADWQAYFLAGIERDGWQATLRAWAPRLAPGLAGVATHGVIRAGHAARALAGRDRAPRRFELATGLAYWASNYEEFAWEPAPAPQRSVEAALANLELRRPAQAPPRGNIVSGLRALHSTPSFRTVAGRIDPSDPLEILAQMAPAFARIYLRHPESRIAFTHAVTAPSAVRLIAPYLDEETVVAGVRYAWQAAAGLYVVYGDPSRAAPEAGADEERAADERPALVAKAIGSGGAHAIKLTEACLRETAFSKDPALLAAAQDGAESMAS